MPDPLPAPSVEAGAPVLLRTWRRRRRLTPSEAIRLAEDLRTVHGSGRERFTMPRPVARAEGVAVTLQLTDPWIHETARLTRDQAAELAAELEDAALEATT